MTGSRKRSSPNTQTTKEKIVKETLEEQEDVTGNITDTVCDAVTDSGWTGDVVAKIVATLLDRIPKGNVGGFGMQDLGGGAAEMYVNEEDADGKPGQGYTLRIFVGVEMGKDR